MTETFSDWRGLLRSEPEAGRRVLQTLIQDGSPMADEEGEFYEIVGLVALPELAGEKTLVNVASPTCSVASGLDPIPWTRSESGCDPRAPDTERVTGGSVRPCALWFRQSLKGPSSDPEDAGTARPEWQEEPGGER